MHSRISYRIFTYSCTLEFKIKGHWKFASMTKIILQNGIDSKALQIALRRVKYH